MEIHNRHYYEAVENEYGQVIVCGWHESLALGIWALRNSGLHTLTSHSYDGELAARFAELFGLPALRGSSSKGGFQALRQLSKALDYGASLVLTVDGPRGPRHEVKPGAPILAGKRGLPILPIALVAQPAWRMRSWDRMILPKPFGRIVGRYAPPIYPPAVMNSRALKTFRKETQDAMAANHQQVEALLTAS